VKLHALANATTSPNWWKRLGNHLYISTSVTHTRSLEGSMLIISMEYFKVGNLTKHANHNGPCSIVILWRLTYETGNCQQVLLEWRQYLDIWRVPKLHYVWYPPAWVVSVFRMGLNFSSANPEAELITCEGDIVFGTSIVSQSSPVTSLYVP
jgi:hypothetical protein